MLTVADQLRLGLPLAASVRGQAALITRDDGTIDEPHTEEEWAAWVPAGGARNWCAGQTLLDWLELFGAQNGFVRDELLPGYDERFDFGRFLRERGRMFEDAAISYLERRVPVHRIGDRSTRSLDAARATVAALEGGDPVIAGGVLRDPQSRVYGRVDLLVREDILREEWPDAFAAEPRALPWGAGARPGHRVIEVTYGALHLLKAGTLASRHRAAMLQVWAYGRALGRIQGRAPAAGYVLGRSWQRDGQTEERGESAWERLGRVPLDHAIRGEALAEIFDEYASWARRLRRDGASWVVLPRPSVPELWPDAGSDAAPWHDATRRIAEELRDLTLLWQVGATARARAHAAGVTSWDDPRLEVETLGIAESKRPTLEAILTVNREGGGAAVRPARLARAPQDWRAPAGCEAYVDFETVSHLRDDFSAFPRRGGQALIFQIGCGRLVGGRWTFAQFTARSLTSEAEADLIDAWIAHLRELAASAGVAVGDVRLFHWSPAETSVLVTAYDSARQRHPSRDWPELGWFDLLERVVRAEPVVVRGAFAFGLKSVGSAMHALSLIGTRWGEGVADGSGAMAGAFSAADGAERRNVPLADMEAMAEVGRYNEIDCRVMAEVLDHLRREH